jgi:Flp pilus assembly protein TadG
MIEMAFATPILVGLFLGMVDFGQAMTADRRVAIVANSMADLVARTDTITGDQLSDIREIVKEIIKPLPLVDGQSNEKLGVLITSIVTDADSQTAVRWTCASGANVSAAERPIGPYTSLPAGIAEANSSIIETVVRYEFTPTMAFFLGDYTIEKTAYFRPRVAVEVENPGSLCQAAGG